MGNWNLYGSLGAMGAPTTSPLIVIDSSIVVTIALATLLVCAVVLYAGSRRRGRGVTTRHLGVRVSHLLRPRRVSV